MNQLHSVLQSAGVDTTTFAPLTEDGVDGVCTMTVPGAEAISLWRRLRELVPQTGHWPVLLGGEEDLESHREALEDADERTWTKIIQQGLSLDPLIWLASQRAEWNEENEDVSMDNFRGEWPQGEHANHSFYVPKDFTGRNKTLLYLGFIPVTQGWEAPAPLRMGGWNDCPFPEVHVCLMKYWSDRYGAELVCATRDIVEMQVSKPPTTRDAALQLAAEHLFYCEDIVTQGTETLERLAATLINGTAWYFWWD